MKWAMPPSFLSHAELDTVIRLAPLIAIDLIIRNAGDEVLLGLRRNEPAKDRYFVPGGMILKNERLTEAFARLMKNETDHAASLDDARLIGVALIMSCSAMTIDGRPRLRRSPTINTVNCVGGLSPSSWPRTACTTIPRLISDHPRGAKPALRLDDDFGRRAACGGKAIAHPRRDVPIIFGMRAIRSRRHDRRSAI
jgi:NUDIX domain